MKNRIVQILFFVIVIVLASFCWILFSNNNKLKANISQKEISINEFTDELELLKIKARADELFFSGNIEEAIAFYDYLDSLSPDTISISTLRLNWINNLDSVHSNLIKSSMELKQGIILCKEDNEKAKESLLLIESEIDIYQKKVTSLERKLAVQYDSLARKFAKEKEELQKKTGTDTLSFMSSKNYRIRYYGQTSGGKANGIGSGTWSTGGYYYGSWKNNTRNGKGIYYWKDGERYEGEYVNDIRQGIGKYFWNNGEKYEGSWKNDQRNGFGTLYDAMGRVKFKGEWLNDTPKEQ